MGQCCLGASLDICGAILLIQCWHLVCVLGGRQEHSLCAAMCGIIPHGEDFSHVPFNLLKFQASCCEVHSPREPHSLMCWSNGCAVHSLNNHQRQPRLDSKPGGKIHYDDLSLNLAQF